MHFLSDLQEDLYQAFKRITDNKLTGEKLDEEIKRHLAANELAKTMVTNGALMAKCADMLYGLPVAAELPLIPPGPAEKPAPAGGKRKPLLQFPRAENYG